MGHFRGEIKLQTSQGKTREKLYGKWEYPPFPPAPPWYPFQCCGVRYGVRFLSAKSLNILSTRYQPCLVDGETEAQRREVIG